jgi:hypothetical protein
MRPLAQVGGWPAGNIAEQVAAGDRRSSNAFGAKVAEA